MQKLIRAVAAAAAVSLCAAASAAPTELITNGDFNGGFTGWAVVDQAGGSGSWFISTVGTNSPVSGNATSAVGGSGNYAVTDQTGGGSHSLFQGFTVDAGASSVFASFSLFANDQSGVGPINAGDLSYANGANQHVRVDVLKAGADPFSVNPADIVLTLLAPMIDVGANPHDFTAYNFDITSAVSGGGNFVLRFAEVDNQFFFQAGVDNVSVLADNGRLPEPASLALVTGALLGLGAVRRTRRR
jgi:hypothetical protein